MQSPDLGHVAPKHEKPFTLRNSKMLQLVASTLCVAVTALLARHWRALHGWWRNQRALALLPHPRSEHWLWGNAQALTRPDFHRKMLQLATEFGGIFSMRLIWFKVCARGGAHRKLKIPNEFLMLMSDASPARR